MIIFLIFAAGGVGTLARFLLDTLVRAILGRRFPWGTLIINISGSLILGFITGFVTIHHNQDIRLIFGVGFCGGFTTFSTASFETVRLLQERRYKSAFAQSFGNGGLSILAAVLGISLA